MKRTELALSWGLCPPPQPSPRPHALAGAGRREQREEQRPRPAWGRSGPHRASRRSKVAGVFLLRAPRSAAAGRQGQCWPMAHGRLPWCLRRLNRPPVLAPLAVAGWPLPPLPVSLSFFCCTRHKGRPVRLLHEERSSQGSALVSSPGSLCVCEQLL